MNLLIAGGLLAFAIVAILVAVFLGMTDQRSEQARSINAPAPQPVVTPAAPAVSAAPAAPAGPAFSVPAPEQSAQASRTLRRTVPLSQELGMSTGKPTYVSQSLSPLPPQALSRQEELPLYAMNGQMHEIAVELRTLHQQAWELEQRLLGLTEMLDRAEHAEYIEHTPGRRSSVEEEVTQEQFSAEAK